MSWNVIRFIFFKTCWYAFTRLNSLYMSQTLNFCNPCFIGDQIIVLGTIKHKSESTKIITLDT